MEWEIKDQCNRRNDALVRQYTYLLDKRDKNLIYTLEKGWFRDKYIVLFELNSFFQVVIGPLASSTRVNSVTGIGKSIPIAYGKSIVFDEARNKEISKVYIEFKAVITRFGFTEWLLNLNSASDIFYQVAKNIRENEFRE